MSFAGRPAPECAISGIDPMPGRARGWWQHFDVAIKVLAPSADLKMPGKTCTAVCGKTGNGAHQCVHHGCQRHTTPATLRAVAALYVTSSPRFANIVDGVK